ncbi:glycosyltransferase [Halomonas sp. TRM85114]|uniref:glycosyltransferase n=1 Tax=Halomonas jincaotanensis TaxID=2810616 RepID=UPI001BD2FF1D|nr:glycosyltransferase [Halomonas jincaotanensis]MBS9404067.1 glycosyltransferase [Halomonas jincaotanensis]
MLKKKTDLVIVNRGFWPQSQVIGEALLQLAEKCAVEQRVAIITQSEDGRLGQRMDQAERGRGARVMDCRSRSDSSTGLIKRSLDALIFMAWAFISLIRCRPAKVYVSTNPPVVVPFIVMLYCKLFGARYYYHLQDIHPEAAHIVVRLNPLLSKVLTWMDGLTMRHAERLITLSEDMRHCIRQRSNTKTEIELLDNPSFPVEESEGVSREGDVVFCGNAGRLQRIPLLLGAIGDYLRQGGGLTFTFAGAGVYAPQIEALAEEFEAVTYHGMVPAPEATALVNRHRWALLPIDDEVTRYAFPSKSSGYVLAGCRILAICGRGTSVARWVEEHEVGLAAEPDKESVIAAFLEMEGGHAVEVAEMSGGIDRHSLMERLKFGYFIERLCRIMEMDLISGADAVHSESPYYRGRAE